MRRDASPCPPRAGLTLVEVCLVLALLVAIAAVAFPAMEGTFSRTALTGASAVVRSALSKARLTAMQSGETQVFRVQPKGARYQVVALSKLGLPESSLVPSDDPDAKYSPVDMMRLGEARLPDRVTFAAADVKASTQVAAFLGSNNDQTWSAPILFNADGTASDASILLQNDSGQTVRVTLRGLTGIASESEVRREAAP
jgi:Tfp pilus assembly protein FimT